MNGQYRLLKVAGAILAIAACGLVVKWPYQSDQTEPPKHATRPEESASGIVPGEFESKAALVIAWMTKDSNITHIVQAKIVAATWQNLQMIILVNDSLAQRNAERFLGEAHVPVHTVRFIQIPFDTIWTRDYGPIGFEADDGSGRWIDFTLAVGENGYVRDNRVPLDLSRSLRMPVVHAPICMQGGNLLSNGDGLFITTKWLLEQNANLGRDKTHVANTLRKVCGAKQVIYLEYLFEEPTGHVDMFATFTATDTVVVGEFPSARLNINAAILDRNAKRLAGVKTSAGPLKVVRIPMPPRGQKIWGGTYTNVVYANGTVLVPTYGDIDLKGEAKAMAIFRRLLPDWNVVGIDARPMIMHGGALHCATLNLFRINPANKPPALY